MDPLVTLALVGTARQEQVKPVTGTPVDALIAGLPADEAEHNLLLSAGAWAVYRRAGQKAQQMTTSPEPAPPEKLRPCPPAAALLLSRLLGGEHAFLLPEALTRLHEVGMYVPYNLLPQFLDKREKELRTALFPVLGERGLWLSGFQPAWSWVRDFLPADENGLPADAETIWQEGTPGQRVEILRRLRAVEPAKAREWLTDVWKQERADMRADLLMTFEVGLSLDDEEFLENALTDRAQSVRTLTTDLLARLPDSAFVQRMIARGIALLQMNEGKLEAEVPEKFDPDWGRDGIIGNPPSGFGKRAWWLIQVLGFIPPTFWETHFSLEPKKLLKVAVEGQWGVNIIDGWSKAAIHFQAHAWILPLWRWWLEHFGSLRGEKITDYAVRENLLACLPRGEAEHVVLDILGRANGQWVIFIGKLAQPWSDNFGPRALQRIREESLKLFTKNKFSYDNAWLTSLPIAAQALPASCLKDASQGWDYQPEEEKNDWRPAYGRQLAKAFLETIHLRQKIYEEIV